MRFSLELPTQRVDQAEEFVSLAAITEVTAAAARAGFAAVYVTDHPAPDAKWLDHGGHHALDPFVALGIAATADPNIALHTNIYVAAYRNPFLGAKSVHSLDVLSGNRLILGVAAGYLKPEFAALGIDFASRGAQLDEALAVLDAVYGDDDVVWEGEGFSARGVRLRPRSVTGRRPPVWVGGNSTAAMRRAARHDGWAPFHTSGYAKASRTAAIESVDDLAAGIGRVRELRTLGGGDAPGDAFDICWSEALLSDLAASRDHQCSRLSALEAVGVTWSSVALGGENRAELIDTIERFGREVIAEFPATEFPAT